MSTVNAGWRGPNIVKEGLVLYLDAASGTSYSPYTSGVTWGDISGNGNNGTLTNGTSYTSGNGGSILFDGVDDYVPTNYDGVLGTNPRSFAIWFNPNSSANKNLIGYGQETSKKMWDILLYNGNIGIHLYNSGAEAGTPYTIGVWQYITFTYTHPTIYSYMNGIYKNSYTDNTIDTGATKKLNIARGAYDVYAYYNGTVANIQIYNRALSAQEVLQNFNAQKSRFNL
jgi:hypothetical protein